MVGLSTQPCHTFRRQVDSVRLMMPLSRSSSRSRDTGADMSLLFKPPFPSRGQSIWLQCERLRKPVQVRAGPCCATRFGLVSRTDLDHVPKRGAKSNTEGYILSLLRSAQKPTSTRNRRPGWATCVRVRRAGPVLMFIRNYHKDAAVSCSSHGIWLLSRGQ